LHDQTFQLISHHVRTLRCLYYVLGR
jgi:hypothetical protein